jgi:hypothetical protein
MKKRPGCSLPARSLLLGWVTPKWVCGKNCAETHADGRYDIPEGDPAYRPGDCVSAQRDTTFGSNGRLRTPRMKLVFMSFGSPATKSGI